jgi:hypothetical protein
MMLPLDQAGARHSQSSIVAHGGSVIEPAYALGSTHTGQYCSLSKNQDAPGQSDQEGPAVASPVAANKAATATETINVFLI